MDIELLNAVGEARNLSELLAHLGLPLTSPNFKAVRKRCEDQGIDISHFVSRRTPSFTDEELIQAVAHSYTMREVHKRLGLVYPNGTVKSKIRDLGISTEHMHNRAGSPRLPHDECFRVYYEDELSADRLKLIRFNLALEKGNECAKCGITTPLTLRHFDGDIFNNTFENLELICFDCLYGVEGINKEVTAANTRSYTDQALMDALRESNSIGELMDRLGLSRNSWTSVKYRAMEIGLDPECQPSL